MNLANKLTMLRIFLTVVLIGILLFPFEAVGINLPELAIVGIRAELKYFVGAIIFTVASFTDFLDGYIARKYNMVTDFGKMVDAIADKMLVNSTLVILAAQRQIPALIVVIILLRDNIVNTIKMIAGSKGKVIAAINSGKLKTTFLMIGIIATLCLNLPFEIWGLNVSDGILILATFFSIYSGVEYFIKNKSIVFDIEEPKKDTKEVKAK